MKASRFEQELAQTKGVNIMPWTAPKKLILDGKHVVGLKCEATEIKNKKLVATGKTFELAADVIFKAIGQTYVDMTGGALELADGKIKVDHEKKTSRAKVWAGGDCVSGSKALTVAGVDDGRRAAESINIFLKG